MQFVERFETFCRLVNDEVVSLGSFETFEAAQDAALVFASEELPTERVKAFQIQRVFLNVPCYPIEAFMESVSKGG